MKILLSKIKPSPDNAAGRSDKNEAMEELIATIKAVGIVEPITVFPNNGGYEIIEGERRWFAAKQAGLKEVDVYIREDVDAEQARLMRLAALTNQDWNTGEFENAIWRELEERDISPNKLATMIGLDPLRVQRAVNFKLGQMEDAVVVIHGQVMARATGHIQGSLKNTSTEVRKAVAEKASSEGQTYNATEAMCARIKKTFPNIVTFGEPDNKDYEEHNFEMDAVLRIEWGVPEYEKQISAMAEAKHKENLARWEAARFGKKELKAFAKGANTWKEELRKILKFKKSFTREQAQFTLNLLDEVDELVKGLTTELESVMKEKDNG